MLKAYNLENDKGERRCGYFDPLTTHGGPQLEKPVSLMHIYLLDSLLCNLKVQIR